MSTTQLGHKQGRNCINDPAINIDPLKSHVAQTTQPWWGSRLSAKAPYNVYMFTLIEKDFLKMDIFQCVGQKTKRIINHGALRLRGSVCFCNMDFISLNTFSKSKTSLECVCECVLVAPTLVRTKIWNLLYWWEPTALMETKIQVPTGLKAFFTLKMWF